MYFFFLNRVDIIYEPLRCGKCIIANIVRKQNLHKQKPLFFFYIILDGMLKVIRFGKIIARNPIRAIYKGSGKEVCLMC